MRIVKDQYGILYRIRIYREERLPYWYCEQQRKAGSLQWEPYEHSLAFAEKGECIEYANKKLDEIEEKRKDFENENNYV